MSLYPNIGEPEEEAQPEVVPSAPPQNQDEYMTDLVSELEESGAHRQTRSQARLVQQNSAPQPVTNLNYKVLADLPRFRKHKELANYFQRVEYDPRTQPGHKCKFCPELIRSHDLTRLRSHLSICPGVTEDVNERFSSSFTTPSIASIDGDDIGYLFARLTVRNNLPLHLLDCKLFKKFIYQINPDVKLPGRNLLASQYIGKISAQLQTNFLAAVKNLPEMSLSIEFDHYKDACHRSILGVVATKQDGTKHLLEAQDVSLIGHSAAEIRKSLVNILNIIPRLKINSLISDGVASCEKARSEIIRHPGFGHIIEHRCIAHLINLV